MEPKLEAERIAEAYGFPHFKEIAALRFTFKVKLPGVSMQRSWLWEPKADRVTCDWKTLGIIPHHHTYLRSSMNPGDIKVDKWFINDRYWLLFPFQLVWDKEIQVALHGDDPLPIPPGKTHHLTVTYPKTGGGYTPGDAYEVYYDDHFFITQWAYRKGAAEKPTITVKWQQPQQVGPIYLTIDHVNASGTFRLTFSNVAAKVQGSDTWQTPQSLPLQK